ncbi:MAG: Na/Pi cotransporter family protein [Defluviitaleaceae bacterium]|nr:Na/Pi cotransporter family protein [Defluviitaleaceae bacterium]
MFGIVFGLLGGLAVFVFGLKAMSEGLQNMAGKKTHAVMSALTSVPVIGVLVGALITIVTQSSTLVTVMVVSFVNTSLLNLKQAISVIMGANIGTTLTAQLVAFRITDAWPFLAAVGFSAYFFAKGKMIKNSGYVTFALGMLLLGMMLMSNAMVPLRHDPVFARLMLTLSDNRVLAVLAGAVFTALIQSSTAATGVIVAMTMQDLIPFQAALPLVLGTNIGTTVTAVFASIGGTLSSKRAAMAHVLFNAFGVVLFLIFLTQYKSLILAISPYNDVPRQVANAHTLFSIINAIIFLPFVNQFAKLLMRIIPGEDAPALQGAVYLEARMISTPNVAINLAQKELLRMADLAGQNARLAVEGFLERDEKKLAQVKTQEDIVDGLEKELMHYLALVAQYPMSDELSVRHSGLLHAANDIERVSDHADNIVDLVQIAIEDDVSFSEEAIEEIKDMYKLVVEVYDTAIQSVKNNDAVLAAKVAEIEAQIDAKEEELRASHIRRLREGRCSASAGVIFLDIIINFERIGDHSNNISHVPLGKL